MSLGLIQPGASVALRHPKTGALIEPIGYLKNGRAVWPVLGAASDDEDDDKFTGTGGNDDPDDEDDEDDDEEDEDDDKDSKSKRRKASRKTKSKSDDDGDDDDDDEDDGPPRAVRQAKRYRLALRKAEQDRDEMARRLKILEDKDKNPDEVVNRDLDQARSDLEAMTEVNRVMAAQLAFFKTPHGIKWVDPSDAFALAEREGLFDDVIDEDGTVDTRELKRGLRDLAKRKKYLVVQDEKPRGSANEDDDSDEDDEEEERPRRSARTANSRRRGQRTDSNRAALEKKFPVLRGR